MVQVADASWRHLASSLSKYNGRREADRSRGSENIRVIRITPADATPAIQHWWPLTSLAVSPLSLSFLFPCFFISLSLSPFFFFFAHHIKSLLLHRPSAFFSLSPSSFFAFWFPSLAFLSLSPPSSLLPLPLLPLPIFLSFILSFSLSLSLSFYPILSATVSRGIRTAFQHLHRWIPGRFRHPIPNNNNNNNNNNDKNNHRHDNEN